MKRDSGFTLIELLVVISIIGLLSSIVLAALSSAKAKARDARRMADIKQLQLALELYRDRFGVYPTGESEGGAPPAGCWGWDTSSVDINGDGYPFIPPLATSGIMAKVPVEPIPVIGGDCDLTPIYKYSHYQAGTNGCPMDKGGYFVLEVNIMETIPNFGIHPLSPGFKCSGRDWGLEGQYTMGGFEG
jgi:general secretion pathway protein G